MNTDPGIPFTRRFGLVTGKAVDSDFPKASRIALFHVLREFIHSKRARDWYDCICELERLARVAPFEDREDNQSQDDRALDLLLRLPWVRVYEFCERIHQKLLIPVTFWNGHENEEDISLDEVRRQFSREVNQVLVEDNFAFVFEDGRFTRPGRHQLQRASTTAHRILARPELRAALTHYVKAQRFYEGAPVADLQNAVKEAVAAIEATAKAYFGDKGQDVRKVLEKLKGTSEGEIPPTVFNALIQIYSFRGAADGVSHGGADGGVVTPEVAELVLSISASYITYLAAVADRQGDDLPF